MRRAAVRRSRSWSRASPRPSSPPEAPQEARENVLDLEAQVRLGDRLNDIFCARLDRAPALSHCAVFRDTVGMSDAEYATWHPEFPLLEKPQRIHPARRHGRGPHPGPVAALPVPGGQRVSRVPRGPPRHAEPVISALVANISEATLLRARVVHLEDMARSMSQWFKIHHYRRSDLPLPDEVSPDERERIYGPIGLGS